MAIRRGLKVFWAEPTVPHLPCRVPYDPIIFIFVYVS
jgi:hypothetical protein